MNRQRKKTAMLIMLILIVVSGVFSQESWRFDADLADGYFWARDYNAAWLFYERALAQGCGDGIVLFRAAKSFRYQNLIDDPEFTAALYATAHHFLSVQYPDDSGIKLSLRYFDSETVVNQRFLRKLYNRVGGKAPSTKLLSVEFGDITKYFSRSIDELMQFFAITKSENLKSALVWAKPRIWHLLPIWMMIITLTGIILPLVMAIAVSREGRKSYITAYALLLHWGFLGIHRFYLGRRRSGIIWLVTGGLLGFGIFFDIFLTGAYVRFWNEDNRDRAAPRKPEKHTMRVAGKAPTKRKPKRTGQSGKSLLNRNKSNTRKVAKVQDDDLTDFQDLNIDEFPDPKLSDEDFSTNF